MAPRARTSASLRMRDGQHRVDVVHGQHGCAAHEPGGPTVVAIGPDEDEALANLGDALALLRRSDRTGRTPRGDPP